MYGGGGAGAGGGVGYGASGTGIIKSNLSCKTPFIIYLSPPTS